MYIRARKTIASACNRRGTLASPQSTKSRESMTPDPLGTLNKFDISAQFSYSSVSKSGTSQRVTSPSNTDYNTQDYIKTKISIGHTRQLQNNSTQKSKINTTEEQSKDCTYLPARVLDNLIEPDHTQILSSGSEDGSTGCAHPSRPSHGRLHRPDTWLNQQVSVAQATLNPVQSS